MLLEGALALGVPLSGEASGRFTKYMALLERWNAQINLTRIVRPEEVVAKHLLDSLAVATHLGDARSLVDVGAGAGFPGVPLAVVRPGLRVTLVESIYKKVAFLEAVGRELGLALEVLGTRLELLPERRFDVAVSRAAFAPPEWAVRGARLVAPGGRLIAMLGRERPTLPVPDGFDRVEIVPYSLPLEGERALAVLRRRASEGTPRST